MGNIRETKRWKLYFHNLRPRGKNSEMLPFKGPEEEEAFKKHIDKLVTIAEKKKGKRLSPDDFVTMWESME